MTNSERIELLMDACTIATDYYLEKVKEEGVSVSDWMRYMELIEKYTKLHTSLLLDYFKDFAKGIE